MGLGPGGQSLLHKLGLKQAWEMSDSELQALVEKDQHRRTIDRAVARLEKMMEEGDGSYQLKKSAGRPRTKSKVKKKEKVEASTLEGYGLSAEICKKLRETGKPEFQLILELQAAGIL